MIRLFLKFSAGTWFSAALSILTLPIITALIRPDEFGRAAMFSLASGLASQLAMLGADQSYAREFYGRSPGVDRAALLRDVMALPTILSLATTAAVLIFARPISEQLFGFADPFAARLLALSVLLALTERFSMLTLRMDQRAAAFSSLRVAFALTTFVVTLAYALLVDSSFHAIITGQVIGLAVVSLVAIVLAKQAWRRGPVSGPGVRSALAYGLPFVPTFAAMWVLEGIDKVALRHLSDFTELGIFSAAYRFIALVALVQAGFSTFWAPVSFELFERDREQARSIFSRALEMMAPLLFLAGLGVLLAKDLIALLFAADYRDAARVMPFLLLVPMLYTLSDVTSAGINLVRLPRWHMIIATLTALGNTGLNLLLVPRLGALGAAVSTGCSYLLFFALRTHVSQRLLALDLRVKRLLVMLAAVAGCCAAHSLAPDAAASYVATIVAMLLCTWLYRYELQDVAGRLARALAESRR
jgi:O-antigen/teichoic acid export membrane protein